MSTFRRRLAVEELDTIVLAPRRGRPKSEARHNAFENIRLHVLRTAHHNYVSTQALGGGSRRYCCRRRNVYLQFGLSTDTEVKLQHVYSAYERIGAQAWQDAIRARRRRRSGARGWGGQRRRHAGRNAGRARAEG
eukprot:6196506-Pleurochrysis_carterae.AAC.2